MEKVINDELEKRKIEVAKFQLLKLTIYLEQMKKLNNSIFVFREELNKLENRATNKNEEAPQIKENNILINELEISASEFEKKLQKKKEIKKIRN